MPQQIPTNEAKEIARPAIDADVGQVKKFAGQLARLALQAADFALACWAVDERQQANCAARGGQLARRLERDLRPHGVSHHIIGAVRPYRMNGLDIDCGHLGKGHDGCRILALTRILQAKDFPAGAQTAEQVAIRHHPAGHVVNEEERWAGPFRLQWYQASVRIDLRFAA